MMVLGIDPSLTQLGWAILEDSRLIDSGVVKTKPAQPHHIRLMLLADGVRHVCRSRVFDLVAIEAGIAYGHGGERMRGTLLTAEARAVVTLAAFGVTGHAPLMIDQATAKKVAVGKGNAKKEAVHAAIEKRFGVGMTTDEADAAAVALAAIGKEEGR